MKLTDWIAVPRATLMLALFGLAACASTPQSNQILNDNTASLFTESVILSDVPFFSQNEYQCGPAALATVLQFNNITITPVELVPQVYLPARQGSLQIEMLAAARRYGRIAYVMSPSLASVLKEVQQQRPVLVMQNLGLSWYPRWHYAVVVGNDINRAELILNSGTIEHYRVSIRLFERAWQRADHWAMIVLTPGELPVDADELTYLDALTSMAQTQPDTNLEAAYKAGVQRWPTSPMLTMGLGNTYYNQGQEQSAVTRFPAVLQRDPNYAAAHNNLARVLFELGDKERALEHAQAAVMLGGDLRDIIQATLDSFDIEQSRLNG